MGKGRLRGYEERRDTLFGEMLRGHLGRKGLSQARLAEEMGIDRAIITHMIKGKRLTGPSTRRHLLAIVEALHKLQVLDSIEEANKLLNAVPSQASLDKRTEEDAKLL